MLKSWLKHIRKSSPQNRNRARLLCEALEDRLAPTATPFQLFDTGVNAAGAPLPGASVDPHYTILPGSPAFVSNPPNPAWVPNNATSAWISPSPSTIGGSETYRTTFDLGGIDPSTTTISLTGRWAVDNDGSIDLNGAATGIALGGALASNFNQFHNFSISTGFTSGINNFDFNVIEFGVATGLRVDSLALAISGDITYNGTGQDDLLVLTATSANSGTYQVTTNGVPGPVIPFTNATSFTFNGQGGDDIFRIQNPAGSLFDPSGGIFYNGGAQANDGANNPPGDSLQILGGSAASVEHRLTNNNDGGVRYNGSATDDISYTGLEPVIDTITAGTRTFTFLGAAETIALTDQVTPGFSTIDSTLGESVTFTNPSVGLVIDTTATVGADTINLSSLDGAFNANFTVTAKATDGVNFNSGTIGIGGGNASITGGTVSFNTGALSTTGNATINAAGSITDGDANNDISAVNLILNAATGIGAGAGTTATDPLEITVANLDVENSTSGGIYVTDLAGGLVLNDLPGDADGFAVESVGPGRITAAAAGLIATPLRIRANASHAASFFYAAGDNDSTVGDNLRITDNAVVTLTSGTSSTLTFQAGDDIVFENAASTGVVTTGGGTHTVNLVACHDDPNTDGDTGSITQSANITSVSTQNLNLFACGTSNTNFDAIGTSAQPFVFDADQLTTDTAANRGNQYLRDTDSVVVDSANGGLNAGTGATVPFVQGHIVLDGGAWTLAAGNGIADGSAVVVRNATTLDLNNEDETIGSLASPPGTTGSVIFGTGTLTTGGGGNTVNSTWNSGNLGGGGAGGLTKTNVGGNVSSFRLASGGSYTFTGQVNVNGGGVLVVNGSLTNSSTVEVGPGILGGTGTLNRPLNANNGGIISPGDSGAEDDNPTRDATGILNTGTSGNVVFNPGSTFFVDITNVEVPGAGYDQLNVTGTVTISTTPPGVILNGTSTAVDIGRQFRIVNNDSTDNVNGTFAGIPEGGFVNIGGVTYGVTYFGGTNNDIVITALGRFDFNTNTSPTEPGYVGVLPTVKFPATNNAFGWSAGSMGSVDRLVPTALFRDYQFNSKERTFSVRVTPNRTYEVILTVGDAGRYHDRIKVKIEGVDRFDELTGAAELTALAGQWTVAKYTVDVGADGIFDLSLRDLGGIDPNWIITALDIRVDTPINADAVGNLELERISSSDGTPGEGVNPANPPFTTALLSTGIDFDVYGGINAPPNSFLTITSTDSGGIPTRDVGTVLALTPTGGSVPGNDANPLIAGIQVQADANGVFRFQIDRPTGNGTAFFRAFEINGKSFAMRAQPYALPNQRHIDFNTPTSGTTPTGYLGLPPVLYAGTAVNALGWLTGPALSVDRTVPNDLLRDVQFDPQRTFRIDLPTDGDYLVALTLGDATVFHDTIKVSTSSGGPFVPVAFTSGLGGNPVSTPEGQFVVKTFVATVTGGNLQIHMDGLGGIDPNFAIAALDIRPASGAAGVISITGPGTVPADGLGSDSFSLSGAPANSLVTVWSELGAVTSPDADPNYAGVQVLTTAGGTASFTVSRPTGIDDGVALITAEQVTGQATGTRNQTYVVAALRRFDMNAPNSPTQAGFLPVRANDAYSNLSGFGWASPPTEFDRIMGASPVDLYRDGHAGSDLTFRIQVVPGQSYDLRLFHFDNTTFHDTISVFVEGSATPSYTIASLPAATTDVRIISGVTSADDILEVRLVGTGGIDPNFVLNGLDVATTGGLPGVPPQRAASVLPGGSAPVLTMAELAPVVEAALRRLAAAGVDAERMALLASTTFTLTDLNSQGLLGQAGLGSPNVVLDNDGAGHGWYVDLTPDGDGEFGLPVAGLERRAEAADVSQQYDLLTVVMHELMHVLGHGSLPDAEAPHDLMAETLGTGTRRLPQRLTPPIVIVPPPAPAPTPAPAPAPALVEQAVPPRGKRKNLAKRKAHRGRARRVVRPHSSGHHAH